MLRTIALRAATGALAALAAVSVSAGTAHADDGPKAAARSSALSTVPLVTINTTGPISKIHLGNELSCQVNIAATLSTVVSSNLVGFGGGGQMYGPAFEPADCGTFLTYGGMLYGPNFAGHSYTATSFASSPTYAAFTPVSQTPVTGSGTLTDPYIVTTVVDAGLTGIRLTRIDTYVNGQRNYRSDVVVTNTTAVAKTGLRLYHGLDCYLAGSDSGTGVSYTSVSAATTRVGCASNNRVMQLVSLTAGNGYYEDYWSSVWNRIGAKLALPNTVNHALVDNGIAIDWAFSLPANGSAIRSFLTDFLNSPLVLSPSKDVADVAVLVGPGEPVPSGAGVVVTVADQRFSVWIPITPSS
jgi:hypothetical protein